MLECVDSFRRLALSAKSELALREGFVKSGSRLACEPFAEEFLSLIHEEMVQTCFCNTCN